MLFRFPTRDAPEATGDEPEDADFDAPKIYEPVASFEVLEERLQMFMAQYNESIRGAGMDLVFFKDAMVHLVKVSRGTSYILSKQIVTINTQLDFIRNASLAFFLCYCEFIFLKVVVFSHC